MTLSNPMLTRLAAVEAVLGSGTQTPSGTITDGLLITQDSGVALDQLEQNEQNDVVSPSLGKRKTKIGSKGGTPTINGNLASFGLKVSKIPAIDPFLQMCGMARSDADSLDFGAAPTNVRPGDLIENDLQTKQGKCLAINGNIMYIKTITGVFADADIIQTVVGSLAVGTVSTYTDTVGSLYEPDSNSTTVGSIFYYMDRQRHALSDTALNFTVSAESSQYAKFSLTGVGKYDVTNWAPAATPAVTYADADPCLLMDSAMDLNFGGTSYTPINTNVEFNFGAVPSLRRNSVDATGLVGGFVSSRSDASGSVVIENETQTDFDYINTMLDSVTGTLDWRVGGGVAGQSTYFHQNVNITNSAPGDENGINTVTLDLNVIDPNLDDGDSYILFV